MKKIGILITILTIAITGYSQEKLSYTINMAEEDERETIEFDVSPNEFYVEFSADQLARIKRTTTWRFEKIDQNEGFIILKNPRGNLLARKAQLQSPSIFTKIEPVLIYKDGTKQICTGGIIISLFNRQDLGGLLRGYNYTVEESEFTKNQFFVKVRNKNTQQIFSLISELNKNKKVISASPDFTSFLIPLYSSKNENINDPFLRFQWAINNQGYLGGRVDADMDVDEAWKYATGRGIKVAVIDDGVDLTHPDLASNLLTGYDATGNHSRGASGVYDPHGTACAGIIGSVANTIGTVGVAYDAKIIPIRNGYTNPINRRFKSNQSWRVQAINWAVQNGADIISCSWGGGPRIPELTKAIKNAVRNGRNGKGCIVLFASGNNGGSVLYPALLDDVIAVGASTMCDERKSRTSCNNDNLNDSSHGEKIDVVAPGTKIYTTNISPNGYGPGNYTSSFGGTSSACPNAAGVVALILSANPNLTQQQVRGILERNTDKIGGYSYARTPGHPNGTWNNEVGYGRVNALKAVKEAMIKITGPDNPCKNLQTTYTLEHISTGAPVTWDVSSDLSIVSHSNTEVTITGNSNTASNSFVKANLPWGKVLTKQVRLKGLPTISFPDTSLRKHILGGNTDPLCYPDVTLENGDRIEITTNNADEIFWKHTRERLHIDGSLHHLVRSDGNPDLPLSAGDFLEYPSCSTSTSSVLRIIGSSQPIIDYYFFESFIRNPRIVLGPDIIDSHGNRRAHPPLSFEPNEPAALPDDFRERNPEISFRDGSRGLLEVEVTVTNECGCDTETNVYKIGEYDGAPPFLSPSGNFRSSLTVFPNPILAMGGDNLKINISPPALTIRSNLVPQYNYIPVRNGQYKRVLVGYINMTPANYQPPNPRTFSYTIEVFKKRQMVHTQMFRKTQSVIDPTGRIRSKQSTSHTPRASDIEIDISSYSSGIYFVKVTSHDEGNSVDTRKVIVK